MKIVICVNDCEHGLKLADFTNRLGFPGAEYHFVSVVLPIMSAPLDINSGPSAVIYADAQRFEVDDAEMKLADLSQEFHRLRGISAKSFASCGAPAAEIFRYAERIEADLIVVGRTERGPVGRLFLGSVSRSIVVGSKISVLVVETPVPEEDGPLRAVIATDHSQYARECIEHLYELAPQGIAQLTILNVYDKSEHERLQSAFPTEAQELSHAHVARRKNSTDSLAREFKQLVPIVESEVEVSDIRAAIREEMKKTNAGLLVLGAHGHTWLERTMLGSISFQQAFGEPYSVLIMRI